VKIVFIISNLPPPPIYRLIMALKDLFAIEIIYWDRCSKIAVSYAIPKGVIAHRIDVRAPLGQWFYRIIPLYRFSIRVIKLLYKIKPDVIHCVNLDMLFIGWIYVLLNYKTKLVYEILDLPNIIFNKNKNPLKHLFKSCFVYFEKLFVKNISFLIISSPFFWEYYYSKFLTKENVLFFPNLPEKRLFNKYRKKPHQYFTIGFIGLLRYPKQIKMLVDTTKYIKDLKVLIAGEGRDYYNIKKYCEIYSHVEFYGPYNYEREIVKLYSKVDCVYSVYDTRTENVRVALPNKLYESIVCELPIIVAKGTVLGEFVKEQGIGFIVPDDDPIYLKAIIEDMVKKPEIIKKIVRRLSIIKPHYYAESDYILLQKRYKQLFEI